jgi:hypothetical protein
MQQFDWVVANAATTSDEARVAREWLEGARRRTAGAASDAAAKNDRRGDSGVHGRVVWAEGQAPEPLKRFQVHLYGLSQEGTPRGVSFHVRTDRDGNYKFEKIPAGIYKLTDDNVGAPKWRLKVEIREGEDALLDLGPENSLSKRDDFPKRS